MIVLRDECIELRPLRVEGAEAHLAGEDAEQIAGFGFPGPAPLEDVVSAIEAWQDSWANAGPVRNFGIWSIANDVLLGNVEVQLLDDRRVNLSYLVFPDFRRRGIATQAARLVLDYAASQLGATTATIRTLPTNAASVGVARALGGREVGHEQNDAGWTMLVFELPV